MKLTERLGKEWIFFDGGMGTILQEHGLKAGELPETWNLSHPDEIIALNRSYFEAGCDVVNTNTFGANALKYPDNLQEIVQAAVSHAKTARQQAGREDAYIALDIGPTGKLLQPMGDLPFERAVELFGETIRIGAAAGADLVLIETMSDSYEAKAAVLAAKENCDLPVLVTLIFDEKGKLLTGGTVDSTVAMLEGLRVDALGVNCGLGPKQMHPIIERLTQVSSLPIIVNPNAGLPRSENGKTVFDIAPAEFSDLMEEIAGMGVQALGGCCGTTPEHLRLTIEKCRKVPFRPPVAKRRTVVSSFVSQLDPRMDELSDLKTAVSEAVTNCIVHAYPDSIGDITVQMRLFENGRTVVKVRDRGCGIEDVEQAMEPLFTTGCASRLPQSTTRRLDTMAALRSSSSVMVLFSLRRSSAISTMPTAPSTISLRASIMALACCRCSITAAISGA